MHLCPVKPIYEICNGKEMRNGLWSPLLKAHRLQRAAFAGADGSENKDVAGSENSDGDNDETEAEEN